MQERRGGHVTALEDGLSSARSGGEPGSSLASAWRDLTDVVRSDAGAGVRLADALAQIRRLVPLIAGEDEPGSAAGSRGEAAAAQPDPAALRAEESEPFAGSFTFLSDAAGVLVSVAGTERGALIGASIAVASRPGTPGADDDTAAAFARRQPVRAARFLVGGGGPAAGLWRIWARPLFGAAGEFQGYEGAARRPWSSQRRVAGQKRVRRLDPTQLPDITRQLVHELRTPINAIRGFAEMIEGEMMGPAPAEMRTLGGEIAAGARRLTVMIEDLDLLAELENDTAGAEPIDRATNLLPLVRRLVADTAAAISVSGGERLPMLALDPPLAERMLSHVIAATAGYAGVGEAMVISIAPDAAARDFVCVTIPRPRILAGVEPVELLDLGTVVGGEWPQAPALGLGFSLRLAGRLAASVGGLLEIEDDAFVLNLPTIAADPDYARR